MKYQHEFDSRGELRDLFAALAMHGLMNQDAATPKWVTVQAYKYADAMLDQRDAVSDTKSSKDTLINECQPY